MNLLPKIILIENVRDITSDLTNSYQTIESINEQDLLIRGLGYAIIVKKHERPHDMLMCNVLFIINTSTHLLVSFYRFIDTAELLSDERFALLMALT